MLTEGLLLALYIKHAQVSNNAKKLCGHGVNMDDLSSKVAGQIISDIRMYIISVSFCMGRSKEITQIQLQCIR